MRYINKTEQDAVEGVIIQIERSCGHIESQRMYGSKKQREQLARNWHRVHLCKDCKELLCTEQ